jgi:general secretion pathway protein D
VFIRDGQTTVIGGLADNVQEDRSDGIPILSRIPGLGWLFGSKQRNRLTSELFLFLTPHVIYTDSDVDKLREAVKQSSDLLKTVPVEARIKPPGDTIVVRIPPRPDTIGRRPPVK